MALSGIQIYKLLPQTNCKDCGFPTCLAFAMKLAAKQADLAACPHVSEESKAQLAESARPPVQLVTLRGANGVELKVGNETVMHRHEKRFFNKPGLFLRVYDTEKPDNIKLRVGAAHRYEVDYVGMALYVDGFAVHARGGDFGAAVEAVRAASDRPLIFIGDPDALKAGLAKLDGEAPMLGCATEANWEAMAALAKEHSAALAVEAGTVDGMVALVEKINKAGVENLALAPAQRSLKGMLTANTTIRRLALKKNFRSLGYPIVSFPGDAGDPERATVLAAGAIAKYGGFVVLDEFNPAAWYPLLVMRENIYTDPQKPIQVTPALYEIHEPGPEDPVLVTTNFSITYFAVANEVDGAGLPTWLVVADAEGMSVLTAWAAGKFDAESIAKAVKAYGVADKVSRKRIVLPGHVAVLSGELEEELPGWEVLVGPREAVDIPTYMKQVLA
ncbi:MAG: acetyl-CoA decarbonylase/synthase complex subunit gamma [Anaerolineae bacterium]|nr:acetyl-CoA decarbonylase/synthase complex subunit gamma [Anaerolineae bacterium]